MTTAAGINKDLVTTTQQAPLGFQLSVPTVAGGVDVYTYVKAGIAIPIGYVGAKTPTAADDNGYGAIIPAAAAMADLAYVGVAQQPVRAGVAAGGLDAGEYGFLLTRGNGTVLLLTASALNDPLTVVGVAGKLDNAAATATNGQMGKVNFTPTTGANEATQAYVSFPG
jgi:hypothetical protein